MLPWSFYTIRTITSCVGFFGWTTKQIWNGWIFPFSLGRPIWYKTQVNIILTKTVKGTAASAETVR